ncbi:Hydroxyethylthiazole kinase family-domain-containing protein [Cercophora scortea]|uniref:Hydroxyethylthiazole kinase family-domain-containing protein n=1 Tax=Cercophora scortea TaxID=314031 RepID=A0AAE0IZ96_9PEZI|nr:Hydroxyethylthiazole kinase family-domain-containing protein [Cercophora scortea]
MSKKNVDFTLYLVTDSTPAILGDRNLCHVVEEAIKGGVTCVQLRDKTADTGHLIALARALHKVTQHYRVPLLINDRVDVALAVGCEGVHIGQDDMELSLARRILGPDAIIGVTVSTVEQAMHAAECGADYLGIGTVYATPTKTNTKSIIGTAGVRDILAHLGKTGVKIPAVCIGGLNESNLQRVVFQCHSPWKGLDGVAVVSAVMASQNPENAADRLLRLFHQGAVNFVDCSRIGTNAAGLINLTPAIIKAVHDTKPLSHNMTNLVVQNFAANVALAVGASPIMSNNGEEAADITKLGGSLVINMGTVTPDGLENNIKALRAYNMVGQPVVFDPVGAGATAVRRAAVKTIMAAGYLDVIKGNEGEIKTVFSDNGPQQRGVDSCSTLDDGQKARLVQNLAQRERNVVVMTGKTDFISDGRRVFSISNGHSYLGLVTGTGCVLGTAISAAVAAHSGDKMEATMAAMLHFEIAAEIAAARPDVHGPGTFVPAFIDELHNIRLATSKNDLAWLRRAKVKYVVVD